MIISEIFYTLQGEGSYTGCPSVFIRTSGCNLRCNFCDTPYTSWWVETNRISVDGIIDEVLTHPYAKHVVISGGEPLMQKDLAQLVNKLKELDKIVTIETNGTIYNRTVQPHLFSISPKTLNSYPTENNKPKDLKEGLDWNYMASVHAENNVFANLKKFMECNFADYQFKFVIRDEGDLSEIQDMENRFNIPRYKIHLMPEGKTIEEQDSRRLKVAEICKTQGYVFCPRVHIDLWGSERGV